MIKLSIPLTKDNYILSVVEKEILEYVDEVYMPVPHSILESARPYEEDQMIDYEANVETYVQQAKDLGLKVSFVANKQFIQPEKLRSTGMKLSRFLKDMKDKYDIDKVVISNLYILKQYGEHIEEMGIQIELSVLAGIDSYSALKEILAVAPCITSVCLSDKMIHKLDEVAVMKEHFSSVELKLIPNHGCLTGCPFEKQHHHYSASTFAKQSEDMIQNAVNSELRIANNECAGCRSYLQATERLIKETSFIRPEDTYVYDGIIDKFKISGREHTAERMIRIIEAYAKQKFEGPIEELFDMSVPHNEQCLNEQFPREFGAKRANCNNQCYKCNYCDIVSQFTKSHSNKENIEV